MSDKSSTPALPVVPKRKRHRLSLIETHPKRKAIERDIFGGVKTVLEISIEYNVSKSCVQRYRRRLFDDVKRVQLEEEKAVHRERQRLKQRMDEVYDEALTSAKKANREGKYSGGAGLLAQANQSMKLWGDLSGVAKPEPGSGAGGSLSQINIANVIGLPKVGAGRIRPREIDGQVIDDTVEVETVEG